MFSSYENIRTSNCFLGTTLLQKVCLWPDCLVVWESQSEQWCGLRRSAVSSATYIYIIYIYRVSQEECARLRESVPYLKLYRYNPKHLHPKLNGYGDNGQRSLKLWQLLLTYWLPNTYWNWQEYVVSVMLIAVRNIKVTCEWHKAIKLNYKNTRTRVIDVLTSKYFTQAAADLLSCDIRATVL